MHSNSAGLCGRIFRIANYANYNYTYNSRNIFNCNSKSKEMFSLPDMKCTQAVGNGDHTYAYICKHSKPESDISKNGKQ